MHDGLSVLQVKLFVDMDWDAIQTWNLGAWKRDVFVLSNITRIQDLVRVQEIYRDALKMLKWILLTNYDWHLTLKKF